MLTKRWQSIAGDVDGVLIKCWSMLLIGTLLQMPSVHMTHKQIADHEPENTLIIGTDALMYFPLNMHKVSKELSFELVLQS